MIPQFGTLVLIRNTYLRHTKMEDTFHCNFTGKHDICSNSKIVGKLFVSGLTWSTSSKHYWPTKIYGFEMPAGQKKSLDFFLKNTREDVFILSAHMTSPIYKWMLNMGNFSKKTPISTSHENWQKSLPISSKVLEKCFTVGLSFLF